MAKGGAGDPLALMVDRHFPGVTAQDLHGGMRAWLEGQHAKVVTDEPPALIVARHGRRSQPKGWAKDARKTIELRTSSVPGGCIVHAVVRAAALNAGDIVRMKEAAHANWLELLEELWASLRPASGVRYAAVAATDWQREYEQARHRLRRGRAVTLLILAGLAGLIAVVQGAGLFPPEWAVRIAFVVPSIVLLWSLGEWAYGSMRAREAAKRLGPRDR